jgi:hypothetical protein
LKSPLQPSCHDIRVVLEDVLLHIREWLQFGRQIGDGATWANGLLQKTSSEDPGRTCSVS